MKKILNGIALEQWISLTILKSLENNYIYIYIYTDENHKVLYRHLSMSDNGFVYPISFALLFLYIYSLSYCYVVSLCLLSFVLLCLYVYSLSYCCISVFTLFRTVVSLCLLSFVLLSLYVYSLSYCCVSMFTLFRTVVSLCLLSFVLLCLYVYSHSYCCVSMSTISPQLQKESSLHETSSLSEWPTAFSV